MDFGFDEEFEFFVLNKIEISVSLLVFGLLFDVGDEGILLFLAEIDFFECFFEGFDGFFNLR